METCGAHMKAINAGEEKEISGECRTGEVIIPEKYWAAPIRALKPVKVYEHRGNLVVVQRVHEGTEEGKYIQILVSSYRPRTGDDGFVFSPDPMKDKTYNFGDGVFNFKRTGSK